MKFIPIFVILCLSSTFSIAQSEIAIIDFDKVLNTSPQKFEFDYVYAEIDSFFVRLRQKQIAVYKEIIFDYNKRIEGGCASLTDIKKMEKEAKVHERRFLSFEKYRTDTLPLFKQKLTFELHKIIQSEIDKYGKYIGVSFIGDTNKMYFHTRIIEDITYEVSFFLKQRYQDPQYKKERQKIIQRAKERYGLDQNLEERFAYSILKKE